MTDIVDGQEIRTRNTALIGAMVESAVDGIVVINERGAIKMHESRRPSACSGITITRCSARTSAC